MKEWAIITGAGRGIGAALTVNLASKGYHVVAVNISLNSLEALLQNCENRLLVQKLKGDVTSDETIEKLAKIIPESEKLKFLVQAAVYTRPITEIQNLVREDLERVLNVNVIAPFLIAKTLYPRLEQDKGRILHTDTLVDHYPRRGRTCYGVSKAAYHKLGQQLKLEFEESNVKVGCAYPGLVKTEGVRENEEASLFNETDQAFMKGMEKKGCHLEPSEAAEFLAYLLLQTSDEEFVRNAWRADDNVHWPKWRK